MPTCSKEAPSKLASGKGKASALPWRKSARALKADPAGEVAGDLDIFRGQIDARDDAAICGGQMPGRSAQAAADIEPAHARLEPELGEQRRRRLAAPEVEFVDGRQIRRRQPVGILAGGDQGLADRLRQGAMGVMGGHIAIEIHDNSFLGPVLA